MSLKGIGLAAIGVLLITVFRMSVFGLPVAQIGSEQVWAPTSLNPALTPNNLPF